MSCDLVYGQDAYIAKWVSEKIGNPDFGLHVAIGVEYNKSLIAGIVYSNYIQGPGGAPIAIEISAAAVDKRWASRHTLRELFAYPFIQLNVERVQVSIPVEREGVIKFNEKLGFVHEGIARKAHFLGGDLCVLSMLKHECKWIDYGRYCIRKTGSAAREAISKPDAA